MKEIKIAFYKAQFASFTDMLISSWTWLWNPFTPPYSHCEIGFLRDNEWWYFSSSIRDGGTRWKHGNTLLRNPERWDIYTIKYKEDNVTRMIERANSINHKKYDVLGILGFITVTGQVLNNKDRWYCSECVFYVLTGMWLKRISPRRLYTRLKILFTV